MVGLIESHNQHTEPDDEREELIGKNKTEIINQILYVIKLSIFLFSLFVVVRKLMVGVLPPWVDRSTKCIPTDIAICSVMGIQGFYICSMTCHVPVRYQNGRYVTSISR